jgi:putative SOS response-associated peptidase YedK
MTRNRDAIIRLFRVSHNRAAVFEPQSAIFPGGSAPIVRRADDGERELVVMSWGFPLPQKGKSAKRVTNAREDTVLESRFWRSSFENRRCLVPVTSFSEPKGQKPAIWHWFALDETREPFAFAGLWRHWRGRLKPTAEPVEMDVYAFLTTRPNEIVSPIHPTRMPVMLVGDEAQETWLTGSPKEAIALARPYPGEHMKIVAKGEKQDAGARARMMIV